MRTTRYIAAAILHLATICFIAMFGICIVNIAMRATLGTSLVWSEEVSRYLIPWVTFLGAALLAGSGLHMTIVDWKDATGRRKTALHAVSDVVTFVTLGYVAFIGWRYAIQMSSRGMITLPDVSMFAIYVSLPIGCALYMLFLVFSRFGLFPYEMGQMYADAEDQEDLA